MRLDVQELVVRFPDGTEVGPLSVEADRGLIQVSGPNGSGKTTLFRALGGALPPSGGQVRVEGRDPFTDHGVRAAIGACSPSPELPGFLTAEEAWRQWAAFRGSPSWEGGALQSALDLPPGLRLDQMSSGQRRRAELLASLAGDPSLLLLDETFAHLDDAGVAWLRDYLDHVRADRLVLLSHHGTVPVEVDGVIALPPARRAGISSG